MADQDEDWKKFLDSTEEDPEEVETEDSEDENEEDDPADKKKSTKKSDKDEDEKPDDEEDSEEEDDSDEEEGDDDTPDEYKPRLKQFLNKDGTLNAKKIEDAYVESGKQAVELNKKLEDLGGRFDNLLGAIKAKPDVAKALFGEEGAKKLANDTTITAGSSGESGSDDKEATHPLLQHLDAQFKNASKREYNEFVEAHPEAVTDPEKARKIGIFLKQHGAVYREENNGEIPSMKESLEAAYRYYGWDLEIENKEAVATAAKKTAATRSTPQGGKKKATKNEVKKAEQFFANKLGVKLRD